MPCESCHLQFTVFRRKRICHECRCFYCGNCLTTTRRTRSTESVLCRRCAIFSQRPLSRSDLLQLKPKDLIFYLQSKHISTAGCVEKEELVCLVLNHLEQTGDLNKPNENSPGAEQSNSFDSLKQSCQNFFSNLSDNISDSFSTFDSKNTAKPTNYRRRSSRENGHINEQPRVSTREIPTYASSQNVHFTAPSAAATASQNNTEDIRTSERNDNSIQLRSRLQSPSSPTSSHVTTPLNYQKPLITRSGSSTRQQYNNDDKSDCECSDDEIINNFSERIAVKTENSEQAAVNKPTNDSALTGLAPSTVNSTSPGYSKQDSLSSKLDMGGIEVSSQSSFEELGAIGGISDESKAATDTTSNSNMDQWQILEAAASENLPVPAESPTTDEIIKVILHDNTNSLEPSDSQQPQIRQPTVPQRSKKVVRRRSDGYLNKRNHSSDEELPIDGVKLTTLREHVDDSRCEQQSGCCSRCGKNKTNIRRHVERMRRHLESSQMSEEDIKRELQEFLNYLEQRTKSIDCSDIESRAVSSLSGGIVECASGANALTTPTIEFSPTVETFPFDENEGIHVYAAPEGYEATNTGLDSRFVNLDDFEDFKDLENLTVKQLKEVLMLHRVDYKGCCEKQELLDRVGRLWKNKRSAPAVDKLATDELCKICMDAPIECVFLECGHMATCTNCGKVLNECPICRQYIVRVVRFFRA